MKSESMRDFLVFYLNGERVVIKESDAFLSLAQFLREKKRLTGTKIVCAEGDCGACTVLVADCASTLSLRFFAIDSCIYYLYQIDGYHVITVEGIKDHKELHPVQQILAEHHATQCGYCTPGFVMTIAGMLENKCHCKTKEVQHELAGNICRCTGYDDIANAVNVVCGSNIKSLSERYANSEFFAEAQKLMFEPVVIRAGDRQVFIPKTKQQLLQLKNDYQQAVLIAGGTDLHVQINKRKLVLKDVIVISHIEELRYYKKSHSGVSIGASLSIRDIETQSQDIFPELAVFLRLFASPQIKRVGTLAGNVANSSPVGDTLPFLLIMDAVVTVMSAERLREVPINDFFLGYKQIDLLPNEIISQIFIPYRSDRDKIRLYKVSKRRDMDIATISAAIRMHINDGVICLVKIAFGGVAPKVMRLFDVEAFLVGKAFTLPVIEQASVMIQQSINPISDVRGSQMFRSIVARNLLLKYFYEVNSR